MNTILLFRLQMNREILPSMMERNSGHIVAISSMYSLTGNSFVSLYCAAKWGINGKNRKKNV